MANPRIISGKARGIRLKDVPGDTTRPITDIVKEALFNILGTDVVDASFLDLFGGTGSVGLEALSRGAAYCRFLDLHRSAVDTIRANLETTHLKELGQVHLADAFAYLGRAPDRDFDYIYIAPPQYKGMWERALRLVDEHPGWMNDSSWVIVQIDPVEYSPQPLKQLVEFEQRKYGSTLLVFYERALPEEEVTPPA
ncbi:MAG: 16S rRNA (guanine(966)-N(2))-methyltransferase RsmD [Anaerolineaceae bacterium]|nr:16S rRNA (guanine(966)-N(2))-methyltransferase RsmD [Anaerolineaceae bacterium]